MSAAAPSSTSSAALVPRLRGQDDSGARLEGLVKAALADEGDEALDKAIADLGVANSADNDAAISVGSLSPAGEGGGVRVLTYDRLQPLATLQPESDISDFGLMPNSGKPEFGWRGADRARGSAGDQSYPCAL